MCISPYKNTYKVIASEALDRSHRSTVGEYSPTPCNQILNQPFHHFFWQTSVSPSIELYRPECGQPSDNHPSLAGGRMKQEHGFNRTCLHFPGWSVIYHFFFSLFYLLFYRAHCVLFL